MQAFLNEATRHHLSLRVYPGNFTEQSGYDAARAIIADGDLPEAVFCANDQMAIGFIRAMHEHGLEAPRDIAVVGCDDIQIARYVQPPLSTIGASRREWGGTAAKWLMRYIEHEETSPPQRIPTTFIVRASSLKRPELLE
jgi:LacI family transcriptional regulator